MTDKLIKNMIGLIMVIGHFIVIGLIIYYRLINKFEDDTLKISLPVVVPLFASYTTLIVKNAIENQDGSHLKGKVKSLLYTFISFFFPIIFILFLIAIVVNQSKNPFSSETFAMYLGLGETIFGIYLGLIIKDIFRISELPTEQSVSNSSPAS